MAEIVNRSQEAGASYERFASWDLADFDVPTGREEQWRFTPIARMSRLLDPAAYGGTVHPSVDETQGARVEKVGLDDERVGVVAAPGDRCSAVSWNVVDEATLITLPRGVELDEPIVVAYRGEGGEAPLASHLVIRAEEGAKARIVIEHTGSMRLNAGIECILEENSSLEFCSLQEWDRDAIHACHQRAKVGAHANLKHTVVTLGGDLVRVCPDVAFAGEGANVDMYGVYFSDSDQHHEHRLWVNHDLPRCRSRVTYKGALQGRDAHSVWVGDVVIGASAFGTDSYELNRNLVLNEGAKADSVPNLEILNGDIEGAGHASATGRFDDEQLFYLMSRGIDERRARKLVVHGFFAEIVSEIGMSDIETRLMDAIDARLEAGGRL